MEGTELGGDQQFCLRWNNFQANITSQFEALRDDEDFVDVTLACEGHRLEAHKVVLSACSPYFKELFKNNPCPHPIIFMRDCELVHITALLEFMYAGEVNIAQAQLTSFLRTAEALQIRGLTDSSNKSKLETKNTSQKSPPSQLRNLLSAKPSNSTSSSKAVSQNNELLNVDTIEKTAIPHNQTRKNVSEDHATVGSRTNLNDETMFPTSSQTRPNDEFSEKINYGAVRLKSDLDLLERKNEDFVEETGGLESSEIENQKTGNINPFAVGGSSFGNASTDADAINDILEPKLEMPDYISDDEMKSERSAFNTDMFFDAKPPISNPFGNIQGNVDFMASLNQDYRDDNNEGNGLLSVRRRRGVPDAVWLEQHRRALPFHKPHQAPPPPKLIKLCEGVELREEQLRGVKWGDYRKVTRGLAAALFSPAELATCSVTGQRWSRAGQEARPTKPPLDRTRVQALISYVSKRFPSVEVSRIKQVLAYKCKENCAALRMRTASESANMLMSGLSAANLSLLNSNNNNNNSSSGDPPEDTGGGHSVHPQ